MAQVISMTLFAFFLFGNNCANQGEASSKNNIGIEQTGVSQSTVRNEATRNSTNSTGVAFSGNRFQIRVFNQGDSEYVYTYYDESSYYDYDYGNYYILLPNTCERVINQGDYSVYVYGYYYEYSYYDYDYGNYYQLLSKYDDCDYVNGYYYEYSYYDYDYGNYYQLLPNTQIQQIANNNITASRNDSLFFF